MKKTKFYLLPLFLFVSTISAQNKEVPIARKLVVGIIVDQMRNDYIYRYWGRFGNGGFKRLVGEGFYFRNAHFNYIPTYTAPGHASIYTGTTPRAHGIIGNDWVRAGGKTMYCVLDTVLATATNKSLPSLMSPRNLISSTLCDELKMSRPGCKIFAVALKDRSAILPAGHAADGAFWYDETSGDFTSSNWYMSALPEWVRSFNGQKLALSYLKQGWSTLNPIATYTNSIADENKYEGAVNKKEQAVFPYDFSTFISAGNLSILRATPFGNSITKDMAIACIKNERLGKDAETDVLSISFSSTDIIAHTTGPRSVEMEDVFLRLDKDIEELLNYLDKEVGQNAYTVFLTADHGGADVVTHLKDKKMPAGFIYEREIARSVKNWLQGTYGDSSLFTGLSNEQVVLNNNRLRDMKLNRDNMEKDLCNFLVTIKGIAEAYPSSYLKFGEGKNNDYGTLLRNGYNHQLSGNVAYIYNAGWMDYGERGTTHGAGYNYDTHVPLIFFGNGVKKGEAVNYCTITQIAPTVCELLKVNQPSACQSEPLNMFFK